MGLGHGGPVMMSDQVREVLAARVDQTIKTTLNKKEMIKDVRFRQQTSVSKLQKRTSKLAKASEQTELEARSDLKVVSSGFQATSSGF